MVTILEHVYTLHDLSVNSTIPSLMTSKTKKLLLPSKPDGTKITFRKLRRVLIPVESTDDGALPKNVPDNQSFDNHVGVWRWVLLTRGQDDQPFSYEDDYMGAINQEESVIP